MSLGNLKLTGVFRKVQANALGELVTVTYYDVHNFGARL